MDLSRRSFAYTGLSTATLMSLNWSFAAGLNGSGIPGSPEMEALEAAWSVLNQSQAKQLGREQFSKNKYGMFIHWGLYSQCGGIWKGKRMDEGGEGPQVAEWIMRRKQIPRAEYALLADTFNPTNFDANEWVAIAKSAGMRYMVITSKHHDGFALFHSKVSDFNVVEATPFKRDIIRELEQACIEGGLDFGVYYSHALDWRDGGDSGMKDYGPKNPKDRKQALFPNYFDPSPTKFDDYIANKSLPQVKELAENYSLCEMWLDTPIYIPPNHSFDFYKAIYEANPEILVNQRIGNGFGDIGIPGDNIIPDEVSDNTWEGIATTNNSWGFKSYDTDWKTPIETLYWLISNVSKGGNFLLNVGPDGTGKIPAESVKNLQVVGQWLKVNGAAIYGSKPWKVAKEGPTDIKIKGTTHRRNSEILFNFEPNDFWFTTVGDKIYVIALASSDKGFVKIKSLAKTKIQEIKRLEDNQIVNWEKHEDGIQVSLPDLKSSLDGYVLEIRV